MSEANKTPIGQVLFSNIKTPQFFDNGKAKYTLTLAFDTSLKSTSELLALIRKAEADLTGGTGDVTYSPIRPRKVRNKASGELEDHATEVTVTMKSNKAPLVLEGRLSDDSATRANGEDKVLPFGTNAEAEFELKTYDFEAKNKETGETRQVRGVSLELKTIGVVSRPQKRSNVFSN